MQRRALGQLGFHNNHETSYQPNGFPPYRDDQHHAHQQAGLSVKLPQQAQTLDHQCESVHREQTKAVNTVVYLVLAQVQRSMSIPARLAHSKGLPARHLRLKCAKDSHRGYKFSSLMHCMEYCVRLSTLVAADVDAWSTRARVQSRLI